MEFTLIQKSTPLGALTCPRKARAVDPGEVHTVTLDTGIAYDCTCGETFEWEDQFHWEAAPILGDS